MLRLRPAGESHNRSGIIAELGELPPGAFVSEGGLARMAGKHKVSIKRAVDRGELPPPVKFLGECGWTAGAIVRHIEKRLEAADKDKIRHARKFEGLRA